MRGKGITPDVIVSTAERMVEEEGYGSFTVRDLAERLNVQAGSLYHHIRGMEDVNRAIGEIAAKKLNDALTGAAEGKTRDEAIEAIAYAYRDFAKDNAELYRAILGLPGLGENEELRAIGRESFRAITSVVAQYAVPREAGVHFARCFRGALHGFVSLREAGYYSSGETNPEESFRFLIRGFINWLHLLEEQS